MEENKELNFNRYVKKQAKELLTEIKSRAFTYGKIKEELQKCEKSVMWSNQESYYLVVIKEAKLQLDKEIDAATPIRV